MQSERVITIENWLTKCNGGYLILPLLSRRKNGFRPVDKEDEGRTGIPALVLSIWSKNGKKTISKANDAIIDIGLVSAKYATVYIRHSSNSGLINKAIRYDLDTAKVLISKE